MNRHVHAIAGPLSLRPPQRRSLEILDRITEIVPPKKGSDAATALEGFAASFQPVTDFEGGVSVAIRSVPDWWDGLNYISTAVIEVIS